MRLRGYLAIKLRAVLAKNPRSFREEFHLSVCKFCIATRVYLLINFAYLTFMCTYVHAIVIRVVSC